MGIRPMRRLHLELRDGEKTNTSDQRRRAPRATCRGRLPVRLDDGLFAGVWLRIEDEILSRKDLVDKFKAEGGSAAKHRLPLGRMTRGDGQYDFSSAVAAAIRPPRYVQSMGSARLEIDLDPVLDELADRIARRLADTLTPGESSPWMRMDEAIEYTRVPEGTFRKWVAEGRIPSHGGRRKLFHRAELDAALGYSDPSGARPRMPKP